MRFLLRACGYASAAAVIYCLLAWAFATHWSTLNFAVLHSGAIILPLGGVFAAKTSAPPVPLPRIVRLGTAALVGLITASATLATYVIVMMVWRLDDVPEMAVGNAPPGRALPSLWILLGLVGGASVSYGMLGEPKEDR